MDPNTFADPPAPTPAAQPPRRRFGCGFGFLSGCLTSLFLLFALPLVYLFAAMGMSSAFSVGRRPRVAPEPYVTVSEAKHADAAKRVLQLRLDGIITGELAQLPVFDSPTSDTAVLTAIEDATEDDTIDALLIEVNSPGGGVTPSDLIYHALENFKAAKEGRKVVVLGGSVIASGAYYLAMQADWIRLQPTSIVGSIGVIIPGMNYAGLAQKLGVADNSVASGASKDLGNPLKPVNPEHNAILRHLIDATYNRFVALVAKGRGMTEEQVRSLADGRVFSAQDALNLRLVDDIGYLDTLDVPLANLLKCDPEDLCFLALPADGWSAFLSRFPAEFGRALLQPLMQRSAPAPEYRWQGGAL